LSFESREHTQENNDKYWNIGSLGLSKRPFFANSWLQTKNDPLVEHLSQTNESYRSNESLLAPTGVSTELEKFFIPGWKGESLFSKSTLSVKKLKDLMWTEAKAVIQKSSGFSRSIDLNIFNEFLAFTQTLNKREKELAQEIENYKTFWTLINDKNSPYYEVIEKFVNVYTFRVATVYFYKARFIIILCNKLGLELKSKFFTNHNNFLMQVFQKGGSKDFVCESLRPNVFSWFSPSESLAEELLNKQQEVLNLNVSQVMKLTSPQDNIESGMKFDDDEYSHAISHKSYGLFVNSLLVFFPLWDQNKNFSYPQKVKDFPQVFNTKFEGDHLRSLCHSHWLAQENNCHFKWSEILCSDFTNEEASSSSFIKICQELQFLSFLARLAQYQGQEVQTMISSVMKAKYTSQSDNFNQLNFLGQYDFKQAITYDKIVLNLNTAPKKNPHHYLVTQINNQRDKLNKDGYLLVSSNQRLFVPSQSSRVEQMLKDFKVVSTFDFENLDGKGEVCNFFYLLKKRNIFKEKTDFFKVDPTSLISHSQTTQESLHTFKWTGELGQFHQFDSVANSIIDFFKEKSSQQVSLYQKAVLQNINFEYHQDAVIEGKLLSSTGQEEDKVTHPNFFKNLTQSCLPFSHFFAIENLEDFDEQYSSSISNDLLGINFDANQRYSHVLIVDLRNITNIHLDILSFDSYKGKRDEFGNAFYQYFGLTQKIAHLNINLFREYFNSSIGRQVIQLTLNGGPKKIKAKLSSFLIPKIFGKKEDIGLIDFNKLKLFQLSSDEILRLHVDELNFQFDQATNYLERQQKDTPWLVMGLLTHFKYNLKKATDQILGNSSKSHKTDYRNPMISGPLQHLQTYPLHPNEEVFLDFETQVRSQIEDQLSHTTLGLDDNNTHWICFHSLNGPIAKIYAPTQTIDFLEFLLSNVQGTPISNLLKTMNLPKASDLESVLQNFTLLSDALEGISSKTNSYLQSLMTKNLNS
tara:strand:- start:27617 stop:30541 length:2925 start_codon:yes stop_codon:yes gene_type:complete